MTHFPFLVLQPLSALKPNPGLLPCNTGAVLIIEDSYFRREFLEGRTRRLVHLLYLALVLLSDKSHR